MWKEMVQRACTDTELIFWLGKYLKLIYWMSAMALRIPNCFNYSGFESDMSSTFVCVFCSIDIEGNLPKIQL